MAKLLINENNKLLVGSGGKAYAITNLDELKGATSPANITAAAGRILRLTRYGKCEQNGTPTPSAPVDIVCNNGAIKARRQSGLPLGFQMVEWIKPAGTIVITDFKTKSTQEITTVFYRESSGATYLYSSDTDSSGTTNTTAYLTSSGNWRWDGKTLAPQVVTGTKMTAVQSANGLFFNGTKWGSYNGGDFVSTNDLRLSSSTNTSVRIYSMTIREGDTVTLDLIPVQRLSDNAYGFYDKVSGNFYGNAEATITAGDTIADPVEIYTDGTPEVLTVSGINLLDPSTSNIWIGQQVTANGDISSAYPNNWRTDYIPVVGGKTYAFWGRAKADNTISAYNRINWYTANKTHIYPRPSYTVDTVTVGTAPSNAAFAMLSCSPYKSNSAITREAFDLFNWMFVESSVEIPYQPYVTPQTASVANLLKVGDYKDEQELINGLLTHKVGIMVFDGTENWRLGSSGGNMYILTSAVGVNLSAICTHFQKISNTVSSVNMPDGSFKGHPSNTVLYFKYEAAGSVANFKDFLASQYAAGTPVIMLYSLATETTEQLTPQHLTTAEGTNTITDVAEVSNPEFDILYKI